MTTYDTDALYEEIAQDLFSARRKSAVTGGTNNIVEKGQGPEKKIREWISRQIGNQYRVTHGHVVNAEGMKSKQIDVIVVKDSPSATMYRPEFEGTELVRAEWVAAVGEVKATWGKQKETIRSYAEMAKDVWKLQERTRQRNKARYGRLNSNCSIGDLVHVISGSEWTNLCYRFLITLGKGKCITENVLGELRGANIAASNSAVIWVDEEHGGELYVPGREANEDEGDGIKAGVEGEHNARNEEESSQMEWIRVVLTAENSGTRSARCLRWFMTDLQLHLSLWREATPSAQQYAKLGAIRIARQL